jgi:ATP adenylyltransferase
MSGTLSRVNCVFCDSTKTCFGNTPEFKKLVENEIPNRIVYETENFVVVPSVGQIVEGYLLIMPKKHFMSIANLDEELFEELEGVFNKTETILEKEYSKPIFFEHGVCRLSYNFNGCCVDHAHIHAVPVSLNISDPLKNEFTSFTTIKKISELSKRAKNANYLFVKDNTDQMFVFNANEIRSQHVRYLIADMLGMRSKGDWTLYPGKEEILATLRRLAFWNQDRLHGGILLTNRNARSRSN